jgi:urease subunit gamma/beta
MRLTEWEEQRLLLFSAAELARRHRDRGLLLNAPEAVAIICDEMLEAARAGASYDEVEAAGRAAVSPRQVMSGVAALVDSVDLEVLMDDGTRLVVLLQPLGPGDDDGPGAIRQATAPPPRTDHRPRRAIEVTNTSSRVVRVSSHYPFERVNARLDFDRAAAAGHRLDLDAGSSERWAPGESKRVQLVPFHAAQPGVDAAVAGDAGDAGDHGDEAPP